MKGIWTLRTKDGAVVARIAVDGGDFPWMYGAFTALPGFAPYAHRFDRPGEEPALTLFDDEGAAMASYLLRVDGDRAGFRWLETDDEDDG